MATTWKAPTWRMPNEKNQSKFESYGLDFDSTEYIEFNSFPDIAENNCYSFSFWFKTTSNSNAQVICAAAQTNLFELRTRFSYIQVIDAIASRVSTTQQLQTNVAEVTNNVRDGEWHHIVFIANTQTNDPTILNDYVANLYLDGYRAAQVAFASPNTLAGVMASTLRLNNTFTGQVSQFCFFNRLLTDGGVNQYELAGGEVAQLYNSGSPINPMTLKPAPIAYYPLGGNASTGGDSTNTLSVPNLAVPDASVFDFDYSNSDAITLGNTIGNGFTQITCSIWVKLSTTELANNSRYRNFLVKFNGTALGPFELRGNYARGDSGNNKLFFRVATDTGSYGFTDTGFAFTEANRWYHIVGTYDGSNVKTFVDGIEKSTISANGTLVSNSDNATIGFDTGTGGFDGEMSNAQIWNTALSSTEIQTLYNNGQPLMTGAQPQEANLKAWYKLDQSANWEADSSGAWQIPDAVSAYPQSFDFDAQDYIEVPQINTTGAISISGWVKTTDANYNMIYNEDEALRSGGNRNLFFSTVGSVLRLNLRFDTGTSVTVNTSGVTLNDGNWHHVAGVWNGTTDSNEIKLFVDGILRGQGTATETTRKNFTMLGNIGGSTATYDMNGQLSNIQTYTTGLTYGSASSLGDTATGQIAELYNNGVPLTTAIASDNLKGWWKLSDNEIWDGTNWEVENQKYPAGFDSALDFVKSESDNITFGTVSGLVGANNASVSVWFKADAGTSSASEGILDTRAGDVRSHGPEIYYQPSTNSIKYTWGITSPSQGYFSATIDSSIVEGQWYNVIVALDVSGTPEIKTYLNGVLKTTDSLVSYSMSGSLGNLTIGSRSGGTSYYDGAVSNASIFNKKLDLTAAQLIYNNGTPETSISESPTNWWKLNNLTTGIQDSIGSNNGTNNGATKVNTFVSTEVGTSSGMTEQNLINNNVSALNGESSGMDTSNLVTSTLTRQVPYNSYSLNFDSGNPDYIDCGTGLGDSLGTYTGDLTLSYWFNTDSLTANRGLFYIGSFSNAQGEFQVNIYANSMRFRVDGGTQTKLLDISGLSTGTWYHIAFVYKAGNISDSKVYLNGVDQSTTDTGTFPSSLSFSGLKTIIGGYYGTGNTFDGKMNNLSLFNETLTSTEVMKLYNSGVPGDLSSFNPSPISWWSLGSDSYFNGANYICPDLVGSNNGTSSGMDANALIGNAPNSTANGTSTNMAIDANLTGSAPNSSNNSFSVNMDYTDRETSIPS